MEGLTNDESQIQLDFDMQGWAKPEGRQVPASANNLSANKISRTSKLGYPFTNNFFPEVTAERGCLSRVRSLLSPFAAISIALRRERILGVCSYH